MTPAEALREAALSGRFNQFEVSSHALLRMRERNVTRRDICCALKTATAATLEAAERWRLEGGKDDGGWGSLSCSRGAGSSLRYFEGDQNHALPRMQR